MKRFFFLLAAACAVPHVLAADVFDALVPEPRLVVRGTNGVDAAAVPDTNGCYRLDIRDGRITAFARDRVGTNNADRVASHLRLLAGRMSIPDATVVDWPDTPHRGLVVDSRLPDGVLSSMRQVVFEAARKRLDTVVWLLEPGTNAVFSACSDRDYRILARFAHKFGIALVPGIETGAQVLQGREGEYLHAVAALVPARGMPVIDLGKSPAEPWRAALKDVGKRLLSEMPDVRLEPLPKSASADGKPYELPDAVANRLWRGGAK